jgi:hypothetical protein
MKKKFALTAGLLLASVILFSACGGAPSYVKNPPTDPKELEATFEDDGWEAESMDLGAVTMIVAGKDNLPDSETDADNDMTLSIETALVQYYPDEDTAQIAYDAMKLIFDKMNEEPESTSGGKSDISVSVNGKTVSIYMIVSGKAQDMKGVSAGAILSMLMSVIGAQTIPAVS